MTTFLRPSRLALRAIGVVLEIICIGSFLSMIGVICLYVMGPIYA